MSDATMDNDAVVDAIVGIATDIFEENFIYDPQVRREVARNLLNGGKLVDYVGQKYELLQRAIDGKTEKSKDPFSLARTQVNVAVGLTASEKAEIAAVVPDVDIRFQEAPTMPHGKANALRTILRAQALGLVSHHSGTVLDIGGNYLTSTLSAKGRSYQLHSCTKLEGEAEHHRQTIRDTIISTSELGSPDYCVDGAENCHIRAPHGISIHALTLIDPVLWPRIFRNHGLEYVVCYFHYDVAIEVDDVGFMPSVDMHWVRKDDEIHCHFDNDSSHPYIHNRDWMLKYGSTWTMTEPDWDYVLYYELEYVRDGIAKSSFTRLEKSTLGHQESIPQFRYIDVDDCVDLTVPRYDASLGRPISDPYAYTHDVVRVPMAMFSHVFRYGLSNDTERPDLPLTYDSVKDQCHTFNHVRRVNGTSLTTPYRLGTDVVNDVAMGMYLLIVKRAALNKVKYTAYTNTMQRLQRTWGDENVFKLLAKATAYTVMAPFVLMAESFSEAVDAVVVYMHKCIAEGLVVGSAVDVTPYRVMSPIRTVRGTLMDAFEHGFEGFDDEPKYVPDVSPMKFYNAFKDTLVPEQRRKVEDYLSKIDDPSVEPEPEPVQPVQVPSEDIVTREQWNKEYDAFQDDLEGKEKPPIVTHNYSFAERTDPTKVWDFVTERIQEYMMYNYDVGIHILQHARDQCRDTWGIDGPRVQDVKSINIQVDAGIVYYRCNEGIIEGMDVQDRYAVVLDPTTMQEFFTYVKGANCMVRGVLSGYVFTSQSLKIFNAFAIAKKARQVLRTVRNISAEAVLTDGVPGCGKTHAIIQAFTIRDVILTTVRETRDATYDEICADPRFADVVPLLKDRVRTIDSANMHMLPRARVLYIDEGLMAHSGAIAMALVDAAPKKLVVYGDSTQIAFIDRGSRIGNLHFQSLFYWTQIIEVNETVRCPADALWISSQFYPAERRPFIKTFSPVRRSLEYEYIPNHKSPVWTDIKYPWVVAAILRGDVGELLERDPSVFVYGPTDKADGRVPVFSVHEVQGRTKPFVQGVRLSPFNPDVVNSPAHINVMVTRHRLRFRYRTSRDASSDKAAALIQRAIALTEEEISDMMLPTPEWLQERMLAMEQKYAAFL